MKTILHASIPNTRPLRKRPSAKVDLSSIDANLSLKEDEAKVFFDEQPRGSKAAIQERKIQAL